MSSGGGVVMVYLDALLDTRIAVLNRHDPKLAVRLMGSVDYWARDSDDFSAMGGPGLEEFKKLYDARDDSIVMESLRTTMPLVVKDQMTKLEIIQEQTPFISGLGMELNIWPYELDPESHKDLVLAMMNYGAINVIPRIVRISPKDLTQAMLRERYSGVIMYDFHDWLKHHSGTMQALTTYQITVIAAELRHGKKHTADELIAEGLRPDIDTFRLTETVFREFFALELYPVGLFSLHRRDVAKAILGDRPTNIPRPSETME